MAEEEIQSKQNEAEEPEKETAVDRIVKLRKSK